MFTILITLIKLFLYFFNSLYISKSWSRNIEIAFLFKYNIFILFIIYTTLKRLNIIFNINIRLVFFLHFTFSAFININLFRIFAFFIFFFSLLSFLYTVFYLFLSKFIN